MHKFLVTLWLMVDPSKDKEGENPNLIRKEFKIIASNGEQAIRYTKMRDHSFMSVWESEVEYLETVKPTT